MSTKSDGRCEWCRESCGTTSIYLFCFKFGEHRKRDYCCEFYEREPGADDNKDGGEDGQNGD